MSVAPKRLPRPNLIVVPAGRSRLRAVLKTALHAGCDAVVLCTDALAAHGRATVEDEHHDRYLRMARQHHRAALACLRDADAVGVARHVRAADLCVEKAEHHDTNEDHERGLIAASVTRVRACLRTANGLVDRVLAACGRPVRRQPASRQPGLFEEGR